MAIGIGGVIDVLLLAGPLSQARRGRLRTAGAAARALSVRWAVGVGAVVVLGYAALTLHRRPELRRS